MSDALLTDVTQNKSKLQFYDVEMIILFFQERPVKLCFTTSNSSAEASELSYEEGDKVWVISQNDSR